MSRMRRTVEGNWSGNDAGSNWESWDGKSADGSLERTIVDKHQGDMRFRVFVSERLFRRWYRTNHWKKPINLFGYIEILEKKRKKNLDCCSDYYSDKKTSKMKKLKLREVELLPVPKVILRVKEIENFRVFSFHLRSRTGTTKTISRKKLSHRPKIHAPPAVNEKWLMIIKYSEFSSTILNVNGKFCTLRRSKKPLNPTSLSPL